MASRHSIPIIFLTFLILFLHVENGDGYVYDIDAMWRSVIQIKDPEPQRVEISHQFNVSFIFYPSRVEGLNEKKTEDVILGVENLDENSQSFVLLVRTEDPEIAIVDLPDEFKIITITEDVTSPFCQNFTQTIRVTKDVTSSLCQNFTIPIKGVFLGRTRLLFSVAVDEFSDPVTSLEQTGSWDNASGVDFYQHANLDVTYHVAVVRGPRLVDLIFIAVCSLALFLSKIGVGCKMDVDVVWEVMKRPIPLVIGFVCQFTIMPTVAFALSKAVGLRGGQALGFFAAGCAPGGGNSNMYTYLLRGDVSLSVTMTLVSVIASLAMLPLWLLTLGQKILQDGDAMTEVEIPFSNIIVSLVSIMCPIGLGIVIQKKKPGLAKKILKMLRPFFIVFIIFMFSFGFYSNMYLFQLFTPQLVLAGMLLPYAGFVLGGFCATIFRQSRIRIIAIAIETGIQNTAIPLLMLKYSLPQPEADLSVIAPVIITLFTPIPLWFWIAGVEINQRCCKKDEDGEGGDEDLNAKKEGRRKVDTEDSEDDDIVFTMGYTESETDVDKKDETVTSV